MNDCHVPSRVQQQKDQAKRERQHRKETRRPWERACPNKHRYFAQEGTPCPDCGGVLQLRGSDNR